MVINEYGNIISIKEKQVKISENVIYSTSTSSTMKEDFEVLLVIDEYTLQVSRITPFPGVIWDTIILRLAPHV
jgi:hypothetical protein